MKNASVNKNITLNVWRLTLGLALAALLSCHNAIAGGTNIVNFTSGTTMMNTGAGADASGNVNVTLDTQGNDSSQQLDISVAGLNPNAAYLLVAFLGDDTKATAIAGFTTSKKGAATLSYLKKSQGNSGKNRMLLPAVLDPLCNIRELDVVNGGSVTVLRAILANPDHATYLVKRSMANTGFLPAAAGDFRLQANMQSTRFELSASGLTPNTDYSLTINGSIVHTYTSDKKGKLDIKKLPQGSPSVLNIQTLALTDGTGANIVLVSGGMGLCTPADQAIPTVSSIVPGSAVTGVVLNGNLAVTFSEAMDSSTINSNTFTLQQGTNLVAGTVTYAGVTAIFSPNTNLLANTLYMATVTTEVRNLLGTPLPADFVWSFTTGATADTTVPTVSATAPGDTVTNVAVNQAINAVFSEAMNPSTINTSSFTLKQGVTAVNGSVSYVNGTAAFAPATNLTANTLYTATITTNATDLSGHTLATNFVWTFTTGTQADTNPPVVIVTNPTNGAANVAINQTVNATFSEAMDPATINTASFTVTGPGATNVTGTVAYIATSMIATFTPTSSLVSGTTYTNMITTGVKDLAGNALATNFVWTFTTGILTVTNPMSIDLGAASTFAILATAAISGAGDQINGDVGLHPGSAQGIDPSEVNGTIHVNDQAVIDAQASLLAAYNEAVNRSANAQTLEGNLGGLTKTPGLYVNGSSTGISGTGANAILTLDAQGDANAVFVFKMASTLTTDSGTSIVLSGGAQAKNVYWQVGSSATLGTTSAFKGNILAAVTITVNSGSMVDGRLFAGSGGDASGAVTVQSSTITVPAP